MAGNSCDGSLQPVEPLDERDAEPNSPIKRLGSTSKIPAYANIRTQLGEQSRLLEGRAEAAAGVASELHEYCRRRADVEQEYARALDKLARVAQQRDRDQRHKREHWPLTGAYECWQTVLESTRSLARDHHALADLYSNRLAPKLHKCSEDALRLHRKCKHILIERHEQLGAALGQAASLGKQHAAASAEWRVAATKLRRAMDHHQRLRGADSVRPKKVKLLEKELDKRRQRHSEARAKALRARFDYVLALESANATLCRFYLDDITDVIMCMETGYNESVARVLATAAEADSERAKALSAAAQALSGGCAEGLDGAGARRRFVQRHAAVFATPRRDMLHTHQEAEIAEILGAAAGEEHGAVDSALHAERAARLAQLEGHVGRLQDECRQLASALDAAEADLLAQMEGPAEQWCVAGLFGAGGGGGGGGGEARGAGGAAQPDHEDYYLQKFGQYVSAGSRLARLQARAAAVRDALRLPARTTPTSAVVLRRGGGGGGGGRGGDAAGRGQFAAPLEEHLAATRRDLPLVLTSCIRLISDVGLRHCGIFRVSGSQTEMQSLRAAFERGEDPLQDVQDASDINSVAGLLKLYLRELRPPILPPQMQDRMVRIACLAAEHEFVENMRELVLTLPRPNMLVLRYLFAFLAHLAEFSDVNMMDEWNLAICMGPTLLAAWGEGGSGTQVSTQNLINELVKRTIQLHRDVFPHHIAPHALYTATPCRTKMVEDGASAMSEEGGEAGPDEGDGAAGAGGACPRGGSLCDHVDSDEGLFADEDESLEWQQRDDQTDRNETPRAESQERRNEPVPSTSQVTQARPPAPPERTSASLGCRLVEATPDLVLDLPAGGPAPLPAGGPAPLPAGGPAPPPAPAAGTADTFLLHTDTLKKKQPADTKTSPGDSSAENGTVDEEEKQRQSAELGGGDEVAPGPGSPGGG